MPPVDIAYYNLLEVPPEATPDELSSAYKKMALKLHPDKGGSEEQFKAMKSAYDVLKNPEKRKLYDSHGPAFVKAMDGEALDPEVMKEITLSILKKASKVVLCIMPFVAALVLFPAIGLSLKWDHKVSWNWLLVISPIWAMHLVVLVLLVTLRLAMSRDAANTAFADADEDEAAKERNRKKTKNVLGLAAFVMFLLIVWEVFVALKLQGYMNVSWFVVLLPYLIFDLFFLIARVALGYAARNVGSKIATLWWGMLRVCTACLVAAKAAGQLQVPWMLCVAPMIVGAAIKVLWPCKGSSRFRSDTVEAEAEEGPIGGVCVALCSVAGWLSILCLAAGKLDGNTYSAFVVLLPYFIIVSTILCCCTCVACLGPTVIAVAMKEEHNDTKNEARNGFNAQSNGQVGDPQYGTMPRSMAPAPAFSGP